MTHRTKFLWLACVPFLFAGCTTRQNPPKEVLVRHHFAGLGMIAASPDLAQAREVFRLPESQAVLTDVARRLAVDLPTWFGGARLGTNDAGPLVPVVRSLLDAESYLEVRTGGGHVTGWALSVRLEPAAAAIVGSELRRVLRAPAAAKPGEAFEMAVAPGKGAARFAVDGGWASIGNGAGAFDDFRAAIRSSGRPGPASATNAFLQVEANIAGIAGMLNLREKPPGPVDQWPLLQVSVEPRNGRFRTLATMAFARPLNLPHDAWQLPTNVLQDPLVGFTAVQGADTWIGRLGLFAELGVPEWPKQLFLWSMAGDPWRQYFAAPIQAPTNLMAQVSLTLPVRAVTNMLWSGSVFSLRITNQATRVEMRGLPYFAPFMEAQKVGDHEQLFGGLFPLPTGPGRPAPEGLLSRIAGRTNLVLYDWETTGRRLFRTNAPNTAGPRVSTNDVGRLIQFTHLMQFTRLMLSSDGLHLPTSDSGGLYVPGVRWVEAALPLLGDTVTEVTQTGPAQLSLVRQSATGFNSMELLYLLRWIENPGFPGWQEPPPPQTRTFPPKSGTSATPGVSGTSTPSPAVRTFPAPTTASPKK